MHARWLLVCRSISQTRMLSGGEGGVKLYEPGVHPLASSTGVVVPVRQVRCLRVTEVLYIR